MNKLAVRGIIVIMALVLIALVSIQLYWIRNAMLVKEQQFHRGVNEALLAASHKMERHDVMSLFRDEFLFSPNTMQATGKAHQRIEIRSGNGGITWDIKGPDNNPDYLSDIDLSIDTIIMLDSNEVLTYKSNIRIKSGDVIDTIGVTGDNVNEVMTSVQEQIARISHKKDMMNDLFVQMLSGGRPLKDRLDPEEMKGMVQTELVNRGINLPFEYMVRSSFGIPVAQSEGFSPEGKDIHRVTLFPADVFSEPNHLFVYFPRQQQFIFRSLGLMSISAFVLILIISFCFAYVVYIIFRQKKLSDMKTDFINNMTHELKTPISTISLASEMLQGESITNDKERLQRYARIIHDENQRLGGQVEKVLQMAVLDKGEFKLKKEKVKAHEILAALAEQFSLQVESRGGKITRQLNAMNDAILADEGHFTHVISNLLDNAIKYSRDIPEITVSTQNRNSGLLIKVTDKGIGMSKEAQKRVFEKFYRVPTGNIHNVKGFGLGLSYVKLMTEAHGGTASVSSEPGKGSTFEIWVPNAESTLNQS